MIDNSSQELTKEKPLNAITLLLAVLILLGPMLATITPTLSGQQNDSPILTVETLIRSQQYDKAIESAEQQLRVLPTDYRIWTLQAIAFSLSGHSTDAIRAFDKALRLSPNYGPALRGETQLLYTSGDKRAIPLLQRILRTTPGDVTAHEMLATLFAKEGECPKAVNEFDSIQEEVEKSPSSLAMDGYCLDLLQHYEEAASVFQKLVILLPNEDYPRYDLAIVLFLSKQYDAALDALNPLLRANNEDADVLSLGSEISELVGNTPQAVSLLRQAIALNPSEPDYYVSFAEICLDHDSFQTGVDMMTVGLRFAPYSSEIYLSRGLLHAQLAEYDAAEADFRNAEKFGSGQSLVSFALDLSEMQRNNPSQALLQVRAQLKADPENPLLNYLFAKLLINESPAAGSPRFREATSSVVRAIRLKPDLVDAHNLMADIYMTEGKYEAAIEQSRIALRYAPDDETATYHLVVALRHAGRKDELPGLVKHLAQLHREAMKKETDRKRFRLELTNR